jgi:putative acyl-CoA dehydrogenase
MAAISRPSTTTHDVFNQPPPYQDRNLFTDHPVLVEALGREGAGWAEERLVETGRLWGGEPMEWGRLANENPPKLRTHDRFGNRIDEVEFHPAWHSLMKLSSEHGAHSLPWTDPRPGAHVARTAGGICGGQVEAGHGCPITMTFAAIPALRAAPELLAEWEPLLMANAYDGELRPAAEKGNAKCGMAMTEKQGGSDVRTNTTRAEPIGGDEYLITGHKWFCSAPMCDLFLVLAQTESDPPALTCFALPRVLPDGSRNAGFQLQRLKDKLGNRSNASSEIELRGALARMVGEPGRGVPTII